MKAYDRELEAVAGRGDVLELRPTGRLHRVSDFEPIPHIGPIDITDGGGIGAGNESTNNEIEALDMRTNSLGQFYIHAISPVEVEVAQTGQQQFRYENAQQRGFLAPGTMTHITTVYVYEDDTIYLNVRNDNTYDLQRARVAFTGFKFLLEEGTVDPNEVPQDDRIPVPVQQLESPTQNNDGGGGLATSQPIGGR